MGDLAAASKVNSVSDYEAGWPGEWLAVLTKVFQLSPWDAVGEAEH